MEMKSLTQKKGFVCGSRLRNGVGESITLSNAWKKWMSICLLILVAMLLLSFYALAAKHFPSFASTKNFQPFTTYHDITVDADLSDWHPDENLTGNNNANWYFTWNETSLFVGLLRGETFHGGNDDYDVLWVYLDTGIGGTSRSVDWNGQHTLPFSADWCFVFKPRPYGDTNYYWNLRHWNGTEWQIDMPYTGNGGYPAWHWDNGTAEIAIPFADIGNPSSVKVVLFLTNGANNWLFGATPTQNPSGASPQTLVAYWNYTALNNGVAPNNPSHIVPENTALLIPVLIAFLPFLLRRKRI